jgi:Acetoacetate decarboxylase (ADC)
VPDEGRAAQELYRVALPRERIAYPPLPWTCAGATLLSVYFEVLKTPHLDRLPKEFCRTSPPYCRLVIAENPDSPAGAFRDATLGLGCRLNMMPAVFATASITDSPKALAAGLFERGYPTRLGKIEFEADISHARATVSDDGGPLLAVTLPLLQTIEPSRLAFDHIDAIVTHDDGKAELMVTSPDFKIERAAICKNARIEYPGERSGAWRELASRNVVSAQLVRGTRTFAAAHQPR